MRVSLTTAMQNCLGCLSKKKMPVQKEIDDFVVDSRVHGRIVAFTPFGAHVDIDGVIAKLNREEISWSMISSADHFLYIGQEVECVVVAADGRDGKFIVSMKRAVPDPWLCDRSIPYRGDCVSGRIVSVWGTGMVVELPSGIHGMVKIRREQRGSFDLRKHFARDAVHEFLVVKTDPSKGALLLALKDDISH